MSKEYYGNVINFLCEWEQATDSPAHRIRIRVNENKIGQLQPNWKMGNDLCIQSNMTRCWGKGVLKVKLVLRCWRAMFSSLYQKRIHSMSIWMTSKSITRLAVTICLLSHGFSHCQNSRKYTWISNSWKCLCWHFANHMPKIKVLGPIATAGEAVTDRQTET